jgi:hypothetical protein
MSPGRQRLNLTRIWKPIVSRIAGLLWRKAFNQLVDLWDREPDHADVELDVGLHQLLQFKGEQLLVPSSVEGEFVIGEHIGSFFCRREVINA